MLILFYRQIFFVDARLDILDSMNYDGSNRRTVAKRGLIKHPFALAVFEDFVYFTDWTPGSIRRMSKLDGSHRIISKNDLKKPMDIQILHPTRQLNDNHSNHCLNSHCSHLCVLKPNGFSCKCPFGRQLKNNNQSCESMCKDFVLECSIRILYSKLQKNNMYIPEMKIVSVIFENFLWQNETSLNFVDLPSIVTISSGQWDSLV